MVTTQQSKCSLTQELRSKQKTATSKFLTIQSFHDFLIFAEMRNTALILASEKGHDTIVKLLIDAGAEIDAKDDLYG